MAATGALCRAVSSRVPWSCLPAVSVSRGRSLCRSPEELQLTARYQAAVVSPSAPHTPLPDLLSQLCLSPSPVSLPTALPVTPVTPPSPPAAPHSLPPTVPTPPEVLDPRPDAEPMIMPELERLSNLIYECINMIRLKKMKMRKHKRKKQMRKNRVSHEKRIEGNLRRRQATFEAEMLALLNEANSFDAEKYLKETLAAYNHESVPTYWKGRRMHEHVVIQELLKLGLPIPGVRSVPPLRHVRYQPGKEE